jgi:hypothetical protein
VTDIGPENPAMTTTAIVNKVWNFCHTLRDDDARCGDPIEVH